MITDIDREAAKHEALCVKTMELINRMEEGHSAAHGPDVRCFRYSDVCDVLADCRELIRSILPLLEQFKGLTAERDALAEVERKGVLSVSREELERLIAERNRLRADLAAERAAREDAEKAAAPMADVAALVARVRAWEFGEDWYIKRDVFALCDAVERLQGELMQTALAVQEAVRNGIVSIAALDAARRVARELFVVGGIEHTDDQSYCKSILADHPWLKDVLEGS